MTRNVRAVLLGGSVLLMVLGCNIPEPGAGGGTLPTNPDPTNPDPTNPDPTNPDPTNPDPTNPDPTVGLAMDKVEPDEGRTAGGELVVIEGQDFVEGTEVFFGSAPSPDVTVYSSVIIHARTPAHKPGVVDVKVKTPQGEQVVLAEAYLFRDLISVTSVEPASAPATGGLPLTIKGQGFTKDTKVLLGGRLAVDITVVDTNTILAISPPGEPGVVDVLASTPWTNALLENGFKFSLPPTLDGLDPLAGPTDAETIIALFGQGLTQNATVSVDGVEATVVGGNGVDVLEISVTGGQEGPADIVVTTADGSALLAESFTFMAPDAAGVTLLNAFPHSGDVAGGTQVVLVAYGVTSAADTTVMFGGTTAQVTAVDADAGLIFVASPAGAGTVPITLENSEGVDTLPGVFSYTKTPVLTQVTPSSGSVSGGDTIFLKGSNFDVDDLEVFVGALPALITEQSATALTVKSPKGSPGYADVRVNSAGGQAVLPNAYTYLPDDGPEFYAVSPNYGAIAGNTLLHLYGAGFTPTAKVKFAKKYIGEVQVVSSSEILVRAPKADEPSSVDITVEESGEELKLADAYSYFDPYSPYGGSWGPTIHGTLNITVLDLYTTDPIPGAFVMLWADPSTPFKGWTDDRGQITFSDPAIQGAQMVTAAKSEYTAYSVVEYDAENVNVHLIPYSPPSSGSGGGPEILPDGALFGKVHGLGKYVVLPPQTCSALAQKGKLGLGGNKSCFACDTVAECGAGYVCTDIADEGKHCAQTCTWDGDCGSGFVCAGQGDEGEVICVPDPGEKAAYCKSTYHRLWEEPPAADKFVAIGDPAKAWVQPDGSFTMAARLGEMAILCFGGVVRDTNDKEGSFVPQILGVARHVEVSPAETKGPLDIQLEVPLTKTVPLRLDGAPLEYANPQTGVTTPTATHLQVAWDFGAEGYYTLLDTEEFAQDRFTMGFQPKQLGGPMEGVTYIFLAEISNGANATSGTQAYKVKVLEIDRMFAFEDGAWKVVEAGIPRDISAMWGTDPANLWAVGADGLIAHGMNGSWYPQFSPTEESLHGVWGASADHAVAVGDKGTIAVFNGAVWTTEDSGTDSHLYAVWGSSPDNMFAVGQGVVTHRGTTGWSPVSGGPPTTLRGIWGATPTAFWAVGDDGKLWHYDGTWTSQGPFASGVALRAIHGTSQTDIWVAGDLGTVLHYDGDTWEQVDVPTTDQINAIHAAPSGEVYAVGNRGQLLRFDGFGWTSETAPKYGGDLLAVWGTGLPEASSFAAGTQAVSLGPMLSFPVINDPIANTFEGNAFSYHLDWTALPSAAPTFNLVEMLIGPGYYFPAWSTVVEAQTQDVTFPNLPEIEGISPLPAGSALLKVNRVLKPGASADNFDFWDTWDRSSWKSWSSDGIVIMP